MKNQFKDVLVTVHQYDQKRVLTSLSLGYDNIDHERTQSWDEFKNMSHLQMLYKNDDLLVLLSEKDFESLASDKGSINIWKAKRLGWFSAHYHKTKVNMQLKGNILDLLYRENEEILVDSFARFRKFEVTRDSLDILAGGIGLSYFLYAEDIGNVIAKIRVDDNQVIFNNIAEEEYQWVIQLFWYWGLLDDAGVGIGSKYDIISDLYCVLYDYLKTTTYDRIEFFNHLRKQCHLYPSLYQSKEDIEEVYNTYIIKNLSITEPNSIQKPLMDFSDLASADLDQLPSMLERYSTTIKKTAVFMLGMKYRHHRISSFVDHDYCLYFLVKAILTCIQGVEIDGSDLIATLKTGLSDLDIETLERSIEYIQKKSEYLQIRMYCENLDRKINEIKNQQELKLELIQKGKTSIDKLEVEILSNREISQNKEDEVRVLRETILEKEMEKQDLNTRLANLSDHFNELAVETGRLENEITKGKPEDLPSLSPEVRLKKNKQQHKQSVSSNSENVSDEHSDSDSNTQAKKTKRTSQIDTQNNDKKKTRKTNQKKVDEPIVKSDAETTIFDMKD